MKRLLMTAAVLAAFGASTANAETISAVGDTFTVTGSQAQGGGTVSFTAVFTVLIYDSSQIRLGIDLTNDSVLTGTLSQSVITSFGFATDPNASSTSGSTNTVYDSSTDADVFDNFARGSLPSLSQIEICTQADKINNQCAGGNINNGLNTGANDLFAINLFGTWGSTTTITDVGAKFQTNIGSFEFTGDGVPVDGNTDGIPVDGTQDGIPVDGTQDGVAVPEPTSLLLLGSGFAVIANRLRRRSPKA